MWIKSSAWWDATDMNPVKFSVWTKTSYSDKTQYIQDSFKSQSCVQNWKKNSFNIHTCGIWSEDKILPWPFHRFSCQYDISSGLMYNPLPMREKLSISWEPHTIWWHNIRKENFVSECIFYRKHKLQRKVSIMFWTLLSTCTKSYAFQDCLKNLFSHESVQNYPAFPWQFPDIHVQVGNG